MFGKFSLISCSFKNTCNLAIMYTLNMTFFTWYIYTSLQNKASRHLNTFSIQLLLVDVCSSDIYLISSQVCVSSRFLLATQVVQNSALLSELVLVEMKSSLRIIIPSSFKREDGSHWILNEKARATCTRCCCWVGAHRWIQNSRRMSTNLESSNRNVYCLSKYSTL